MPGGSARRVQFRAVEQQIASTSGPRSTGFFLTDRCERGASTPPKTRQTAEKADTFYVSILTLIPLLHKAVFVDFFRRWDRTIAIAYDMRRYNFLRYCMSIACRDRDSPWSQAFPGRAGQSVTLRFAITGDSELTPTPTLVKR